MLIIALVMAVIGLAALVTAVVTSNEVIAWVCIGASVIGVILLIIDALRERQKRDAVPASDSAAETEETEAEEAGEEEEAEAFDAEYPEEEAEPAEPESTEEPRRRARPRRTPPSADLSVSRWTAACAPRRLTSDGSRGSTRRRP